MKLGIMQPYFFPYLGYFDLINRSDRWIVFDTPQYKARSWMNRNRIHHPAQGWQYIVVPVAKFKRYSSIREIRIKNLDAAKVRILAQLGHYRESAPFFDDVTELVRTAFKTTASDSLVDLNMRTIEVICSYLGIGINLKVFSEMNITVPKITHPGQWALEISSALGADEYINPPGGRDIFNPEEFRARKMSITFTDLPDFRYDCSPYAYIDNLSVVDVLMWAPPHEVKYWLDEQGKIAEHHLRPEKRLME